jgi:MYXO-CTERM domain-containing protein
MSFSIRLALATALLAAVAATHAAPVTGQGTWESELHARDISGNAVALSDASAAFFWDSRTNLTWLANMNANGPMTWGAATAWAGALTTGGFTDWRLPTIIDSGSAGCNSSDAGGTDCGYNVQNQVGDAFSEWADLYYTTLGNKAFCPPGNATCAGGPQAGWGLTNTAYFQNMRASAYWSGTAYVSPGSGSAWDFYTQDGYQGDDGTGVALYAVAVRSGDVLREAGTVPEPQTLALALLALGAAVVTSRRRQDGCASRRWVRTGMTAESPCG